MLMRQITEAVDAEFVALLLVLQAPFLLRQLQMEMKMPASSACLCSRVFGNRALIPEQKDTVHNTTLLSHNGCRMQASSIKNENPKVDIEVDIRIFCFYCFEMYLHLCNIMF